MNSNLILQAVMDSLRGTKYLRHNKGAVEYVFGRLGVSHSLLKAFFEIYRGPFWSEQLAYELFDIEDGVETLVTSTETARDQFGFPPNLIVLTQLAAGQVVVLDTTTDNVYEVDFEGGDSMLLAGTLPPRWGSLAEFLTDFFIDKAPGK